MSDLSLNFDAAKARIRALTRRANRPIVLPETKDDQPTEDQIMAEVVGGFLHSRRGTTLREWIRTQAVVLDRDAQAASNSGDAAKANRLCERRWALDALLARLNTWADTAPTPRVGDPDPEE